MGTHLRTYSLVLPVQRLGACRVLREVTLRVPTVMECNILDVEPLTVLTQLHVLDIKAPYWWKIKGINTLSNLPVLYSLSLRPMGQRISELRLSPALRRLHMAPDLQHHWKPTPASLLFPGLTALHIERFEMRSKELSNAMQTPGLLELRGQYTHNLSPASDTSYLPSTVTDLNMIWQGVLPGPKILGPNLRHLTLQVHTSHTCFFPLAGLPSCEAQLETLDLVWVSDGSINVLSFIRWILAGPSANTLEAVSLDIVHPPRAQMIQLPFLPKVQRLCVSGQFRLPKMPRLWDLALLESRGTDAKDIHTQISHVPRTAPNLRVLSVAYALRDQPMDCFDLLKGIGLASLTVCYTDLFPRSYSAALASRTESLRSRLPGLRMLRTFYTDLLWSASPEEPSMNAAPRDPNKVYMSRVIWSVRKPHYTP